MTTANTTPGMARILARRSRRISAIWIIPLLAVGIGGWLAWNTLSKQGPMITIAFDSGEGLQAGQSQLKFKDMIFGTVQSLDLAPDHSHVRVSVRTTSKARDLLTEATVFWVVKPRLFAGNLSGLDTLLSGAYIGVMPGPVPGAAADRALFGKLPAECDVERLVGRTARCHAGPGTGRAARPAASQ